MASAPEANALPILFNDLVPLSSVDHKDWKILPNATAKFIREIHAFPLGVEEFALAQRNFPIVFSSSEPSVPLALMGLNEGVNTFVNEDGFFSDQNVYVPAYIRRYPFLLARLTPDSDELSLCLDPSSGLVGPGKEGEPLFDGDQPTEVTKNIMKFCEEFEMAWAKTQAFVKELEDLDLLIDGEVAIEVAGAAQPFIYRGFRMVSEEKLRELSGDKLRKMNQNGMLPLVIAHMFSMSQMSQVFNRQAAQGQVPGLVATQVEPEKPAKGKKAKADA